MNTPFISICIPVYNAAKYLDACINSILKQSFPCFEIILIDDGSTDNSPAICDSWSAKSEQIRVIHQPNSGVTPARGHGAMAAAGEWVLFVDADDSLPQDALETLLEGIKEDTDIIIGFSFETEWPAYFIDIKSWREKMIVGDIVLCSPWGRLFRKSILSEKAFSLAHPKGAGTDMIMNEKIAFATEKPVYILNKKVYEYTILPDSLSHATKWTTEMIIDRYEDIFNSVPENLVQTMMPALIESRLKAIQRVILSNKKHQPVFPTPFSQNLRQDIKKEGYPLSFLQRLSAYYPDARFASLMHRVSYRFSIGKEYLQRVFKGQL